MASFVVFEDPVLAPGDGHAAALQQKAGKPAAGADKENMDPARREREREAHEHSIARGELRCTASEQLDRWIEYLKWAQRSGLPKQDVLGLLERCTKTFKADKALRSQRKYLRVWINYADACYDKEGVFEFMWSNKIGVTHALYYEAVAAMHETGEGTLEGAPDLHRAARMLSVGIKMKAEPVDRLRTRQQELKRRTLRRLQKEKARRQQARPAALEAVAEAHEEAKPEPGAESDTEEEADQEQEQEQAQAQAQQAQAQAQEQDQVQQKEAQEEREQEQEEQLPKQELEEERKPEQQEVELQEDEQAHPKAEPHRAAERHQPIEAVPEPRDAKKDVTVSRRRGGGGSARGAKAIIAQMKPAPLLKVQAKTTSGKDAEPAAPPVEQTRTAAKTKAAPPPSRATKAELAASADKENVPKAVPARQKPVKQKPKQKPAKQKPAKPELQEQEPEDQEPEPWVGTKKAKARRRKKLYQPKFDGEAPAAEDGGFSLFTDKNGRDCR